MKISRKSTNSRLTTTDLLIVLGQKGKKAKMPPGVKILPNAVASFNGTEREVCLTDAAAGPAKQVLQVGLGKAGKIDTDLVRRAAAIAVKKAEKNDATSATFWIELPAGGQSAAIGQALAEGAVMGSYHLDKFKSDPDKRTLKRVTIHGERTLLAGARRGEDIGKGNCLARRLQDTPANLMRPRDMVAEARRISRLSPGISIQVIDEKAMAKLKMGSLLSVSQGSAEPAYLIHLVYRPTKKAGRKICLVGKGLTFDSGGISIKPAAKMDEMKYDMSGGAAVLGTFHALAALQPDVEVHGLVPTSENLINGKATKPGDLVKACNGLSIEVLNTDAEGRLILADALAYASKKIQPDAMIDHPQPSPVPSSWHSVTNSAGSWGTMRHSSRNWSSPARRPQRGYGRFPYSINTGRPCKARSATFAIFTARPVPALQPAERFSPTSSAISRGHTSISREVHGEPLIATTREAPKAPASEYACLSTTWRSSNGRPLDLP